MSEAARRHTPMTAESDAFDFAVVGESVAGVLMALGLRKRGASVVVLEDAYSNGALEGTLTIPPTPISPDVSSGAAFVQRARELLSSSGVVVSPDVFAEAVRLPAASGDVMIQSVRENVIRAARVVYAPIGAESGLSWLPQAASLVGLGVSMDAWSDAPSFAGQQVAVVGSDLRAAEQALLAVAAGAIPTIYCPFARLQVR